MTKAALHRVPSYRGLPSMAICTSSRNKMEAAPLASLSLTHVHYVRSHHPPHLFPKTPTNIPPTGLLRPHLLPMRLARPRPPNPLRHLRNPNMVDARSGDPPHVHRTDGLRSLEFHAEENY